MRLQALREAFRQLWKVCGWFIISIKKIKEQQQFFKRQSLTSGEIKKVLQERVNNHSMLPGPFLNSIYVVIIVNTRNHPLSKMGWGDEIYMYICKYVCVYVYIYIYICTHLYIYGSRGQWWKWIISLPFMEGVNR